MTCQCRCPGGEGGIGPGEVAKTGVDEVDEVDEECAVIAAVVVTDAEGDAEAVSVVIADELLVVCIAPFEIKRAGGGGEGWSDWLSSMRG